MPLSVEELLRPRYKVIADYPQPPFTNDLYNVNNEHIFIEGDLLTQCNVNGALTFKRYGRLGHMSVGVPCCAHPEKFPKIFKPLQWWEDRKVDEMPEHVKWDYNQKVDDIKIKGLVEKVIKWVQDGSGVIVSESMTIATCHWLPASEADYNAYINHE
jgi:hypothetical protein